MPAPLLILAARMLLPLVLKKVVERAVDAATTPVPTPKEIGMQEAIGVLVRHGITLVGGFLVAKGQLDATDVATLAGAGATIAGVVLSFLQKRKAKQG